MAIEVDSVGRVSRKLHLARLGAKPCDLVSHRDASPELFYHVHPIRGIGPNPQFMHGSATHFFPRIAIATLKSRIHVNESALPSVQRKNPVNHQDNPLPTGFQSLMYCDQLSCAGAMDVIRVQLASPVLGVSSVSPKASNFVSADVLVGSDGIARGIRVVE